MKHPGTIPTGYLDSKTQALELKNAGWKLVAELEGGGGYDWSIVAVWRHLDSGRLYYDDDSGCSCYGPWDHPDPDNLRVLDSYTSFRDWLHSDDCSIYDVSAADQAEFLRKVRRAAR